MHRLFSSLVMGNQRIGSKEIVGRHSENRFELRAVRRCSKLSCRNYKRIFFNNRLSRISVYCAQSFHSGVFDIVYH
ncbi:hypothetical protein BCV72DRAFT_319891 [Rhizopus microsporus var. microsporus]|uniref:Uncharacterized protein n=1 Tax=Rhizopus microsporus var. microsporus TaxID=86635 RepID=A0A1X0RBJ9_RHIZD|nr:hypothetical protein BCV72DRAFT_319891 [Rhizopus microsporus var. microsporus]